MPVDFELVSYAGFNSFLSEVNVRESQLRIHLDTAPINSDGTIGNANLRLELDYFPEGTDPGGTRGGRFSGITDEHGHPNRAIGVLGGTWTHEQGGQGRFIGNFRVSSHPVKPQAVTEMEGDRKFRPSFFVQSPPTPSGRIGTVYPVGQGLIGLSDHAILGNARCRLNGLQQCEVPWAAA